ncbi:MAG: SDR family oxidoreductase [Oscillospiraceae bacterium]|nr:SDR family oxidoreductase [Oscillospiraceae bacterium]
MLLKGKNAVVTGCMQGIGMKTMEVFAREGANVWALCLKPTPELEETMQRLRDTYGVWIKPIYFDLSDEAAIKDGLKQIMADKLPVHALANVAGITHNALFHMTTMADFQRVFQIDFFAQMQITQFVTKLMLRAGGGSVVFVTSDAAITGNAGQIAYSAAKGAVISAVRTLSAEFADRGIRVNAVSPGVVDTAMTQALTEEQRAKLLVTADIKRLGKPEEIAEAIAYLASDLSSYVTGQVLRVNGGCQ